MAPFLPSKAILRQRCVSAPPCRAPLLPIQSRTPRHVEEASPAKCDSYEPHQSPRGAYFGDDLFCDRHLGDESVWSLKTPVAKKSPYGHCDSMGLPCKSPMSAYFDGDLDDFNLAASPEGNYVPSPSSEMNSSQSSDSLPTLSPEASFNLMQVMYFPVAAAVPQPMPSTAQTPKSALRQNSGKNSMRVRWADESEQEEKACIRLTELLDIPASESRLPDLQGRVWELSQDAKGCRLIQDAVDGATLPEAHALVAELRGHVCTAVQCPHANHVLRKIIMTMPAPAFNFIFEELISQGASHMTDTARHRFGCRIIEGLLSKGDPSHVLLICECLLPDAVTLCNHMYANFVMQRMFEHAPIQYRSTMIQLLRFNLAAVGANFFGSAVLGKAVQHACDPERHALAIDVASYHGLLAAIAKFKHGKSIVNNVLSTLNGVEWEAAVRQLSAPPLKAPKVTRGGA